jgi:ribosomal protein L29
MARLHQLTGAKMTQAVADGAFEVPSSKELQWQAPNNVGGGVVMPIEVAATGRERANQLVGGGVGGTAPFGTANAGKKPDAMTPKELEEFWAIGDGAKMAGVLGAHMMTPAQRQQMRGPVSDYGRTVRDEVNTGMKVGSPEAKAHADALAKHRTGDIYGYSNRAADLLAANRASGFGVSRPIGRRKDELLKAGAVERVRREEELTKRGNNQRDNEARKYVSDNNKAVSENEMKNQLATLKAQLRIAQLTGKTKEVIAELQRRIAAITKYLNGGWNAWVATAPAVDRPTIT